MEKAATAIFLCAGFKTDILVGRGVWVLYADLSFHERKRPPRQQRISWERGALIL